MNTLLDSVIAHSDALRGLRKALNRFTDNHKAYLIYYPTEDSVHVRRVRRISVWDEDRCFQHVFKDGQWVLEPNEQEVPF